MSEELNVSAETQEAEVAIATPETPVESVEEFTAKVFSIANGSNPDGDLDSLLSGLNGEEVESKEVETPVEEPAPTTAQPETPKVEAPVEEQKPKVEMPSATDALFEANKKLADEIALLKSQQQAPPVQAQATVTEEKPVVLGEPPVAPVEPSLPDDIADWTKEDTLAYKSFNQAMAKYTVDNNAYLTTLSELVTKNSSVAEIAGDVQALKAHQQQQQQELDSKLQADAFWTKLRGFQSKVPELQTDSDILAVHEGVNTFAQKLAAINGVDVNNPSEVSRVLGLYNANDEKVLAMATAGKLEKPDGFDNYQVIANLVSAQQADATYANLPLDEFWLIERSRSGDLQGAMDSIAATEREKTMRDVADTVKASRENVTIPDPSVGATTSPLEELKFLDGLQLSAGELVLAKEVLDNPALMSNPKYYDISNKIDKAVNRGL